MKVAVFCAVLAVLSGAASADEFGYNAPDAPAEILAQARAAMHAMSAPQHRSLRGVVVPGTQEKKEALVALFMTADVYELSRAVDQFISLREVDGKLGFWYRTAYYWWTPDPFEMLVPPKTLAAAPFGMISFINDAVPTARYFVYKPLVPRSATWVADIGSAIVYPEEYKEAARVAYERKKFNSPKYRYR